MSVLETVLCEWLDLHSYDQDSVQNDTGYVKRNWGLWSHERSK